MTGSDLTGLGAPATKLIEVVSAAVGAVYEPRRIRRKAAADADARQILAKADLEIAETTRHALQRLAVQETRRQENIEEIVHCAVGELPHTVSAEPVDPDWTSRFFSACQDVSNEELQAIWGKILAGEVAKPGSCSRRTLSILSDMSAVDARAFERLCAGAWVDSTSDQVFVPIYRLTDEESAALPLQWATLLHLNAIGLCHFRSDTAMIVAPDDRYAYHGREYVARITGGQDSRRIRGIVVTLAGVELYGIVRRKADEGLFHTALDVFAEHGVTMEPAAESNANAPSSDAEG